MLLSNPMSRDRQLTRERSLPNFKGFSQDVKTRDIYGFEVDARRSPSYRAFYEKFQLNSQRQVLRATELLESGVFKNWNCLYTKGKAPAENAEFEKVAALVRDGLPIKSRGEIWLHLTGVAAKARLYEGVYENLLEPYEKPDQYGINNSPSTIQIEKDVPRTFPGYVWTPKGKKFQPALRRLLRAYAMRNPSLGYCQSMNFIAGGLLLFLDEADAFWMLCHIVEEVLPDYFTKNIIGPQIDAEVLTELMEQLPELRDHFETIGVSTVLVSTQWFMCLFIRTLPIECAFRIWDSMFLYGPKVLFEVGIAILKKYQQGLFAFEDTIDIVTHLGNSLSDLFDCSLIWDVPITPIDHKRIVSGRIVAKEKVKRDMRMRSDILDLMDTIPSSKFTREALEELYNQYANLSPKLDAYDVVQTGLKKSVFSKIILRICQWQHEEYFMDRLFRTFDTNRNNRVDFKELINGLAVLCKGTNDEKLRMCFMLFDRNGDGFVDREEFHIMLTALYTICNDTNANNNNNNNANNNNNNVNNNENTNNNNNEPSSPKPNRLTQSGGAHPPPPHTERGVFAQIGEFTRSLSSRRLVMSDGAVEEKPNTQTESSSTPNKLVPSGGAQDRLSPRVGGRKKLAQSGGIQELQPTHPGNSPPAPVLLPLPKEPEKEKVAPDFASEVAFFVDMLFLKADVTKDEKLSPEEFREAALLHPFTLKIFNLDHQQNYDVRISMG